MRRNGLALFVLLFSIPALAQSVVVSNVRADSISHSSLRLIWDNSTPINAVRIRYGFTSSYELGPGGATLAPGTALFSQYAQTASLSGLQPDTVYHFCPQSSNDGGKNWSACVDWSAKLLPLPTVHPEPPAPAAEFDISYPAQNGAELLASQDCSNLQDLINQARYGDTILIPPGTTCSDSYTLPTPSDVISFPAENVDAATDQITIPQHPFPEGQRVHLDSDLCLPASAGENIYCVMRGLLPGSDFYVHRVDDDHIQLNKADGTPVTFAVSTFTANSTTGQLTIPTESQPIIDGYPIQVRSTGALPGGLQPRVTYYVVNPKGLRTVQLSLTPGGVPIPFSHNGQGTHSFTDPGRGTDYIIAWPPEDKWIVVRTATPDNQFCPEGVRCLGEIWASKMARIAQMTPPTNSVNDLRLLFGHHTHHWRFVGIEFTHADNSAAAATTTDPLPYYGFISTRRSVSNIILDRCYIHGLGAPNRIYRAIDTFDGSNMALINSDLEKLDFWHPGTSSRNALMPAITNPKTITLAPGTIHMGVKDVGTSVPVTITLTEGNGSGRAVVYYDFDGLLHVDLPLGVQGTCTGKCVASVQPISDPWYPNNNEGRIGVAQVTDLAISNGAFTSVAYRASFPQSSRYEGSPSFIAGNGPGPFLIQNNTISSTGVPIHFDDSGGTSEDRHDYVVRRNLFTAPLSQQGGGPLSDGLHYFHRNMLEWKAGQRILVDGNVFENNFADMTPLGAPLVFTPRAGGYVTDVMIRNNTFRHNAGGIILAAVDSYSPVSKPLERVAIVNNLFHNNDGYAYTASTFRSDAAGILIAYGYAAADLRLDHNTMYDNRGYDPAIFHLVSNKIEGAAITNNFFWINNDTNYKGVSLESIPSCPGLAGGDLLDCVMTAGGKPSYIFSKNILMPGVRSSSIPTPLSPTVLRDAYSKQLPDNWVIDGLSVADRVMAAGLNTAGNSFRLTPGSTYAADGPRAGTDGKAIGADMDQLEAAQGIIGTPTVAFDGVSAAAVNVRVPDEAAACYVFYGQGNDIATFARTPADTSIGRVRSIRIESFLPDTDYNYVVFCSGATNFTSGSFKSSAAEALRVNPEN